MPGKVKVRILAGRNLPVMDRSSDTSDAFVELKFGSTTYKTDVFRKSLNPHWNSEWFKFEAEDEELQDEPIQIRVMDYDTYSANDAIGKVFINLKPLLTRDSAMMRGWFPIFDTMHGIRGEVQIVVKLDLFSDFNRFRSSSCGVKVFFCAGVPEGYALQAIQGFVEELIVNDDPEYQWIDKIRTPRASNEARQMLLWKLAGEAQRKVGLKALELGGNAVLGYQQNYDLEGESGIVLRCIGTAVTLVKDAVRSHSNPNSPHYHKLKENVTEANASYPAAAAIKPIHSPLKTVHSSLHKNESEFCIAQRTNSLSSSGTNSAGVVPVRNFLFNQDGTEVLEYPFITLKYFPADFIEHLGGIVSAKSVKLLDRDEPETRDCWWTEIRMEVRSHSKALGCNVVIGYSERVSICDDVCILSAQGTAALVNVHFICNSMSVFSQATGPKDDKHEYDGASDVNSKTRTVKEGELFSSCKVCHIPYSESSVPFPATLSKCLFCKQNRVPDVLFTTIEPLHDNLIVGKGCLIQARVSRSKRDCKGETSAKEISDSLPFLEYELHRQLSTKLKLKGMNALFGLQIQVSVGERLVVAVATGTGILLAALPRPLLPQVVTAKMMEEKDLIYLNDKMTNILRQNKEMYDLNYAKEISHFEEMPHEKQLELDLSHGSKDAFILELDDAEDSEILTVLNEHRYPNDYEITNSENIPGSNNIKKSLQLFTRIWRSKFPVHELSNEELSNSFEDLIRTLFFKVRNAVPCGLINLQFQVDLPEEDELQVILSGMLVSLNQPNFSQNKNTVATLKMSNCVFQSHMGSNSDKSHSAIGYQLHRTMSMVQPSSYSRVIELSSLSYIPNGNITEYLGNLSFCLIRECTDVREYGNLSGFIQSFLTEVQAIARAHVCALGGNAFISMRLSESVMQHNLHKNQGQSLLFFSGDAVVVDYSAQHFGE